jgi:hypothetical protein
VDLNDQLTPNEHGDLRDRVVGGVKRLRAARARRSRIVAGAAASALVAVVVAGVAFAALRPDDRIATPVETSTPTPTPTPTPSQTPQPMPTATSTPDAEPQLTAPVIAFGGDCGVMMTTGQWDDVLGQGSRTVEDMYVEWGFGPSPALDFSPVSTLGGLTCDRFAPPGGVPSAAGVEYLEISVIPLSALPPELAASYNVMTCEGASDGQLCRKSASSGEWWIMAQSAGIPDAVPEELLDTALRAVEQNLVRSASAHAAVRRETWWRLDSCEGLMREISLEELVGDYVVGYWEGEESDETRFFASAGVNRHCPIVAENGESFIGGITLFPGAGWAWEARTRGAEILEAGDGIEAVIVRAPEIPQTWVYATDGTNVVQISGGPVELQGEMLLRLMPALEDLASSADGE